MNDKEPLSDETQEQPAPVPAARAAPPAKRTCSRRPYSRGRRRRAPGLPCSSVWREPPSASSSIRQMLGGTAGSRARGRTVPGSSFSRAGGSRAQQQSDVPQQATGHTPELHSAHSNPGSPVQAASSGTMLGCCRRDSSRASCTKLCSSRLPVWQDVVNTLTATGRPRHRPVSQWQRGDVRQARGQEGSTQACTWLYHAAHGGAGEARKQPKRHHMTA